jgi:hypothetical protein
MLACTCSNSKQQQQQVLHMAQTRQASDNLALQYARLSLMATCAVQHMQCCGLTHLTEMTTHTSAA